MLYPKNLDQKINFVKIKDLLKAECTSGLGQEYVDKIAFSSDYNLVQRLLDQTEEFRQILIAGDVFPSSNFTNLIPFLEKGKTRRRISGSGGIL